MALSPEEIQAKNIRDKKQNASSSPTGKRVSNGLNFDQSQQDLEQNALAISASNQALISQMNLTVARISDQRNNAIEKVSDVLAYLHSPVTFQAEIMQRTAEKLGMSNQQDQPNECLSLDGLAGTFDVSGFDVPRIANSAIAGCLPL